MKSFLIIIVLAIIGGVWYTQSHKTTGSSSGTPEKNATVPVVESTPPTSTPEAPIASPNSGAVISGTGTTSSGGTATESTGAGTGEAPQTNTKVFAVAGVNFKFDVEEIRVKKGDTVTINFMSTDGFHDWVVDEFDARTKQVRPGTPTSITFVADKAGTFEYYCSVGQHRAHGMIGKLIVE